MIDILNALVLMTNFIFIPGLVYGSQLGLGALGITLIYGVLRFSNFSHGEIMSFGAMATIFLTWYLQSSGITLGAMPTALLALPFGIVAAIILVLILDRLVFRYYRRKKASNVTMIIVSVGVMFFINGLVRFLIGPDDRNFADGARFIMRARDFKEYTGLAEGLTIRTTHVITIVAAVILVAAVFWFLEKTRTGKSLRAFSDNEDLALISGINPTRVVTVTWIIAAALAAVAGTLYGLDKSYKPFTYLHLLLPIFASAIVGGVGRPLGAIAGGFIIAFSELSLTFAWKKVLGYILPETLAPEGLAQLLSTDYKIPLSFVILVIVLLIRPQGVFGGKTL